jgi:hypothetical protein
MKQLRITRPKRARGAYKIVDAASRVTDLIPLEAIRIEQKPDGRWGVVFRMLPGTQRTKVRIIPVFWDTDVGAAVLAWNRDQGGENGALCAGSSFITKSLEDATMMRLAFA